LGRTENGRNFHKIFTVRKCFIRVVSARPMHKKERTRYEKKSEFKSEAEEMAFWEENDSSDCFDWSQAERVVFTSLKPTTKAISLSLSESMLAKIKVEANKRDIPCQSLLKMWLSEHLPHHV